MKETILNRLSDEDFLALANESNSVTDLISKLGYKDSSSKICSLVKDKLLKLNFDLKVFKEKNTSILNDLELLEETINQSYTYSDVLRKFNLAITGGNQRNLKKYIAQFNLDVKHFDSKKHFIGNANNVWNSKDIFIVNSPVETVTVRRRILKENLIPYQCNKCGNKGEWCGESITLQLEHKNGNNKDHRLNNLEFLCPNCHSQTLTYGGKNIKLKVEKITSCIIPVIKAELTTLTKEINKYNYLDDILAAYKVKKCKLNRDKLINMLTSVNDEKVNLFLKDIKNNNVKKVNFPLPEFVYQQVKETGYVAVAKSLNCSDNGVKKYLKRHGLI